MANLESQSVTLYWDGGAASTDCSTASTSLVGQVVGFSGPTGSASKIDVSNLDSAGKEFLMGLPDEGDISLDVIYDPADAGHLNLWTDRGTRTKRNWLIKLTDGSSNAVKGWGFCTGFSVTGAVDDAVKATITVAITKAVEISVGTTLNQAV